MRYEEVSNMHEGDKYTNFWQKFSVEKTAFETFTYSQHSTLQYIIGKWFMDIWSGLIWLTILGRDGVNTSVCKRSR